MEYLHAFTMNYKPNVGKYSINGAYGPYGMYQLVPWYICSKLQFMSHECRKVRQRPT